MSDQTGISDFRVDLEKFYRIEFAGRPPTWRRNCKLWLTHFGLHCVAIYRLGRWVRAGRLRRNPLAYALHPIYEFLCFLIKLVHHVDIFAATVGPGFYIGHVGTIYIGPTSIGANFSVTHNVTIGIGASAGSIGIPVVGRDVWVGAGSILYGGIDISDGVAIIGGTVLSRSIPARCLAGGNPGRVILRNYDNARLLGDSQAPSGAPAPQTVPKESATAKITTASTLNESLSNGDIFEALPEERRFGVGDVDEGKRAEKHGTAQR